MSEPVVKRRKVNIFDGLPDMWTNKYIQSESTQQVKLIDPMVSVEQQFNNFIDLIIASDPKKMYISNNKYLCGVCYEKSIYGNKNDKFPTRCTEHKNKEDVNFLLKKCTYQDCKNDATHVKKKTRYIEFCKSHAPKGYRKVECCKYNNCIKHPSFGISKDDKEFCKEHAPINYVNVNKLFCKIPNCNKSAIFGIKNTKEISFCREHAPIDHVNKLNKLCIEIDCLKMAYYGPKNTKQKIFCRSHAPIDYVNTHHKLCIEPGCNLRPSYAKPNAKTPIYCQAHKKDNYIDVQHKK